MTKDELIKELQQVQSQSVEPGNDDGKQDINKKLEFYQKVFEDSPIGMTIYNSSGQCIEANKSIGKIIGATREQVLSQNYFHIESWKRSGLLEAANKAVKTQKTINKEATLTSTFGKKLSANGHFLPFSIDKNNYLLFIFDDITQQKRLETELQQSEEFLNVVFDAIQDGISILDTDLTVVRANKVMRELYAHLLPFEGKKKCYEVYQGRSKPCEICPTIRTLESGRLEMNEVPLTLGGEVKGTYELFSFPIIDESGKVTGVVEHVRDITDRKQAEEKLYFLSQVSRQVVSAIITTNTNFEINWTNPAFTKLYGYTQEEVIGRTPDFLNAETISEKIQKDIYQTVSSGKTWRGEALNKKKDGSIFPCEMEIAPLTNEKGEIFAYSSQQRDITESKQAEEELEKERKSLEEVNIALKVLLRESSQTKDDLEENMRTNIKNLLLPYLTELESRLSTEEETFFIDIIKSNIDEITSSFSRRLAFEYSELTPREIQVADLIRQGRTNKEIARLLGITSSAVDFHRRNLRIKFKIKGKKTNLRSHLLSFVG
jgi:PAS domain S-box-containing protein